MCYRGSEHASHISFSLVRDKLIVLSEFAGFRVKIRSSRSAVLTWLVVVALLATAPLAIVELMRTGEFYLLSDRFAKDIVARFFGLGRLRFILQPSVAILLGVRDGTRDSRAGASPFLWDLFLHSENRRRLVGSAFASVRDLVAVAILLDLVAQFLILRIVNPFAALLLGLVLIARPYASSRALTNRFQSWRKSGKTLRRTSAVHDA